MAQAVFSFVGTAIGGPIGGFVGNLLGSLLDGILFPSSQPKIDQHISVSTYGTTIPRLYGPENRVAGEIIWFSGYSKAKGFFGAKGGFLGSGSNKEYVCDVAIAFCEGEDFPGAGNTIVQVRKIWANSKMIFNADYRNGLVFTKSDTDVMSLMNAVRIYPGTFTQLPDPTIEAKLGINSTTAFRGTAYLVIEDIHLADFGNTLPNLEVLVEVQSETDLAYVLVDIAKRSGIDPNSISASDLAGIPVRGYAVGQQATAADAIAPLQLAYAFDAADQGGNLRFIKRGSAPMGYVTLDELAGHVSTDVRPEAIHFTRDVETKLPKQATIIYSDPNFAYQPNSQTSIRTGGSADSNLQTQVAVVLTDDEGKAVADRVLWEAWNGRTKATTTVTDRWVRSMRAGQVYTFDTPVGPEPLRITRLTRGPNGLIQIDVSRDYAGVYSTPSPGSAALLLNEDVALTHDSRFVAIDCPILKDADDNTGFYVAISGTAPLWRGADFQRSIDNGVSFTEVKPVGGESSLGAVAAALPAGPTCFFDTANTITVVLDDPSVVLESVTEDDVLAGMNAAWLGPANGEGGEVLQFADATQTSPGTWVLSHLLRGRQGTEYAVGIHGTNEVFAVLEVGVTQRFDFGPGDWNKDRKYRAVTAYQDPTVVTPADFTNTGEGKRPYAGVHPSGSRDGSNNLTLAWVRRSRLAEPGLGNGPVPLGESTEAYEVDIVVSAVVVRTINSSTSSIAYSAADQTADGITPGDPVSGNVYQLSDVRGRGHALAFTV